MLDKKAAE